MKKIVATLFVSSCLLAGCSSPSEQSVVAPAPVDNSVTTVMISNNAYSPAKVVINAGQTVQWHNNDPVDHTVSSDYLGSNKITPGQTYSFQFINPGDYKYTCEIHPNMRGEVVVK